MKMRKFIVFLLLSFQFNAQESHPMLNYFTASVFQNSILLDWEIKGGETCNGMSLFRSSDSINFVQIADFPGVCGDINSASRYSHADISPIENTYNYYKVRLGTQGDSDVLKLFFVKIEANSYSIFNDELNNSFTIYFHNAENEIFNFEIINQQGKYIDQKDALNGNSISLESFNRPSGIYFFNITFNSGRLIKGKLFHFN